MIGDPLDRTSRRIGISSRFTCHPGGPVLEFLTVLAWCCHALHPSQVREPPTDPGRFTPWGNRQFKPFTDETLASIRQALTGTTIQEQDFRDALSCVEPGDFVYLDPPYLPIFTNPDEAEPTSKFNKYTAKVFNEADLKDLAALCRELTDKGAWWVLSNRDTSGVRDLFDSGELVTFTTHRPLSAQANREVEARKSPEAIIVGRPQ
ncbi:MAG: DNA adenine methylase [Actinomycetota bacterium]|nr:DNA adenine methylase [Actinomycetota bacterium]